MTNEQLIQNVDIASVQSARLLFSNELPLRTFESGKLVDRRKMLLAVFLLLAKLLVVLFGLYSSIITTAAEICKKDDPCCFPPEVMNISGIGMYTLNRSDCIFVRVVLEQWNRKYYFIPTEIGFPVMMQYTMFAAPLSYAGVVRLAYINVHSLSIDEKTQQISTDGSMHLEWKDERFVWDRSFKMNNVVITVPKSRIWIPKMFFFEGQMTHPLILITNGGQISYGASFSISTQCPFDYSRYPFDSHTCCSTIYTQFNFSSSTTSRTVKGGNNLISSGVFDNPTGRSRLWSEIEYKITEKPVDRRQFPLMRELFDFCFTFKRESASVTTEIVLPLAVTIFLSVLTPMFGAWKTSMGTQTFWGLS